MNSYQICVDILNKYSTTSFRFRPKNDELVKSGLLLMDSFSCLTHTERCDLLSYIDPNLRMKLMALSGFMAEAAINQKDASFLYAAVVLHVIEDFRKDYRENIRYLVLIFFAAKELGLDPSVIASSALLLATDRTKEFLTDFLSRDPSLNSLSSFGIRKSNIDGEFRFVPE